MDPYDSAMPRFVVLRHETPTRYARGAHFDLMLEHDGVLRTWAMNKMPTAGEAIAAERLPDHRRMYLDYEGEVKGERGHVSRVDAGTYDAMEETATAIVVRLDGERLRGTLTLAQDEKEHHRWRVSLSPG